jgi:hypothetical protein
VTKSGAVRSGKRLRHDAANTPGTSLRDSWRRRHRRSRTVRLALPYTLHFGHWPVATYCAAAQTWSLIDATDLMPLALALLRRFRDEANIPSRQPELYPSKMTPDNSQRPRLDDRYPGKSATCFSYKSSCLSGH